MPSANHSQAQAGQQLAELLPGYTEASLCQPPHEENNQSSVTNLGRWACASESDSKGPGTRQRASPRGQKAQQRPGRHIIENNPSQMF